MQNIPKVKFLEVKLNLHDTRCLDTCAKNILLSRHVVGLTQAIQTVQETKNTNTQRLSPILLFETQQL